jgi:lambda repressor-like predicted transcriptional regulator
MKQNTPLHNGKSGWDPRQIKARMVLLGVTAAQVAQANGFSSQGVRLTIRGERRGLPIRKAIAQALGEDVQTIWPDALLPLRERRLHRAS